MLSVATVASVGLLSKAFLNSRFCSISVNGLPTLLEALNRDDNGNGVITVSNHISTLDDPLTWGILPARCYLSSRTTRWSLGASDIIFTNPVFSTFFRLGQTLETFRGKGIYQPAIDASIAKLNSGAWVHIFSEGKVNQPRIYFHDTAGIPRLPRFKWGIGRMLMETTRPPTIIPMWLSGFEDLMPEGRPFPYKYLPRPGAKLGVTFGTPINGEKLQGLIPHPSPPDLFKDESSAPLTPNGEIKSRHSEAARIRMAITAIIQEEVEALGKAVADATIEQQAK